jgi:hypothetical protein
MMGFILRASNNEAAPMDHVTKFEKLVQFRAPEILSNAIDAAARRHCQTRSEYIRRSVFDCLKAEGIDPSQLAGAA